ncbi:MAG: hypothetical protein R2789_14455 [Microthrixaceae bacterium]
MIHPIVRCWNFKSRASSDSHRPVASLDLGGDDGVGVQLRIHCPRRVLTEQRCESPRVSTWAPASVPRRVTAPWCSNRERRVNCES